MKLLDIIVCDDIRQEVDGKQSLIGVYNDLQFIFPSNQAPWPISLKIGVFVRFKLDQKESIPDFFEINFFQNGNLISNFNGNLKIPENTINFNLVLVNNAFILPGPGQITFEIIFKNSGNIINKLIPEYSLNVISNTTSI